MKIPLARTNMLKFSIKQRGSQLFNLLQENNLVPVELQSLNEAQFLKVIHRLRYLFNLENNMPPPIIVAYQLVYIQFLFY